MPTLYGIPEDDDLIIDQLVKLDFDTSCPACAHYQGGSKCAAFKQIPADILSGRVAHTKPVGGDNGIQFTAKGKKTLANLSTEDLAELIEKAVQVLDSAGKEVLSGDSDGGN